MTLDSRSRFQRPPPVRPADQSIGDLIHDAMSFAALALRHQGDKQIACLRIASAAADELVERIESGRVNEADLSARLAYRERVMGDLR